MLGGFYSNMNRLLIGKTESRHTERDGHVTKEAETRVMRWQVKGQRRAMTRKLERVRRKSPMGFRGAWAS